jgi:hypothetical protein
MTSDRNKKVPNEFQLFYANEFPLFTLLAIPTSLKHKFKVYLPRQVKATQPALAGKLSKTPEDGRRPSLPITTPVFL